MPKQEQDRANGETRNSTMRDDARTVKIEATDIYPKKAKFRRREDATGPQFPANGPQHRRVQRRVRDEAIVLLVSHLDRFPLPALRLSAGSLHHRENDGDPSDEDAPRIGERSSERGSPSTTGARGIGEGIVRACGVRHMIYPSSRDKTDC